MAICVYTDGACKGNPGPGGWGVFIDWGSKTEELFGGEEQTTNNRMELMAAIKALTRLNGIKMPVTIVTDSEYVKNGIESWVSGWKARGWKTKDGKDVKNKDLWVELDAAQKGLALTWKWVKGHADNAGNQKADDLANKGVPNGGKKAADAPPSPSAYQAEIAEVLKLDATDIWVEDENGVFVEVGRSEIPASLYEKLSEDEKKQVSIVQEGNKVVYLWIDKIRAKKVIGMTQFTNGVLLRTTKGESK